MSREKKILSFTAGLIVLFSIASGIYWVMSPEYAVLLTTSKSTQLTQVASVLEANKIEYLTKSIADKTQIDVAEDDVAKARMELAKEGIVSGKEVGFELFDHAELGMTDFQQKINYQRALQGELARTIMSLSAVESAHVHLVLPEDQLFKQTKAYAKAAVDLTLRTNANLSQDEIKGIQLLIASSVPELDSNHVTIVDDQGQILSESTNSIADGKTSEHDQQEIIEQRLLKKVRFILSSVFPNQSAQAEVAVSLSHDAVEKQREDIIPFVNDTQGALGAVESRQENHVMNDGQKNNDNVQVKYLYGKEVSHTSEQPGKILTVNVGVLVPVGTESSLMANLRELIVSSLGLNPTRGDNVNIQALLPSSKLITMKPEKTLNVSHMQSPSLKVEDNQLSDFYFDKALWVECAVIVALVVLLVFIVLIRKAKNNSSQAQIDNDVTLREKIEVFPTEVIQQLILQLPYGMMAEMLAIFSDSPWHAEFVSRLPDAVQRLMEQEWQQTRPLDKTLLLSILLEELQHWTRVQVEKNSQVSV